MAPGFVSREDMKRRLRDCRAQLKTCEEERNAGVDTRNVGVGASQHSQASMLEVTSLAATTRSLGETADQIGQGTNANILHSLADRLDDVSDHAASVANDITNQSIQASMHSMHSDSDFSDASLLTRAIMEVDRTDFAVDEAFEDTEAQFGVDPGVVAQDVADGVAELAEKAASVQNQYIPIPGQDAYMDDCMKKLMEHHPEAFTREAFTEYETSKHLVAQNAPPRKNKPFTRQEENRTRARNRLLPNVDQKWLPISSFTRSKKKTAPPEKKQAPPENVEVVQQKANDVKRRRGTRVRTQTKLFVPGG